MSVDSLEEDAHLQAIGLFRDYVHPSEGRVREVRPAMSVSGVAEEADVPPPHMGQDTRVVLGELGYSEASISELSRDGVVFGA